jgi:acetoin utilization deacetylase AcuC-like enzyme
MTTLVFTHPECRLHDMGRGHPECGARLDAITDHLRETGLDAALTFRDAPLIDLPTLYLAHSVNYVKELDAALIRLETTGDHHAFDPDTIACAHTRRAVRRAAGAAVAATEAVVRGEAKAAFCAIRPPGHHATRDTAMGFCFYNNVAVAARHALDVMGIRRVAIVDFDVHHGNGTEDIIAGDERIFMASFFQHPLYPGSGAIPKGTNMVNLPVPPYTRGPEIRKLIDAHWMPQLDEFKPEMIFISAGFDAHREDELGQLGLVEADYEWITSRVKEVAERHAQGRIVSCLEGGYNLGALARSVATHLRVLAEV